MESTVNAAESRKLFEQWVKQHSADLLRFARNRVKDPDIADDLVQLTLVSAWETMRRFAGESSPRTWLFAILKHKLMDHYRKAYREGMKVSGEVADADEPDAMIFDPNGHWLAQHAPALRSGALRRQR
ncbi:MAG: sigma-70 family RNA polymerase sigma factor [Flavobacteriales bacterium]|nr:sigma-70 family RNA polymerase sigma factor [Flavobacteriales bacterium]